MKKILTILSAFLLIGCSAQDYRLEADKVAGDIIAQKQNEALGRTEPLDIERPADTLRRRLLLGQNLQYSSKASLGVQSLDPIPHWPDDDYLTTAGARSETALRDYQSGSLQLNLIQALQVAAFNSSEYQSSKEQVYLAALDLDLERDEFRTTFFGLMDSNGSADYSGDDLVAGVVTTPQFGLTQRFQSGLAVTSRLMFDIANLLTQDSASSLGIAWDSTITMPLLRGAGEHIVAEPLTQAERNVVYAILDFEQFKRDFAVEVASAYLEVLQERDEVQNNEESYRRLIQAAARSNRLAAAGRLPEIQVDQAVQEELQARDRWIAAMQSYAEQLDQFKVLIGLPPDALVELDRDELNRLAQRAQENLSRVQMATSQPAAALPTTATTTQEIEIEPPSMADAGPYELPETQAIQLALANRPDLRIAQGQVYDFQRQVVVAANGFLPDLTLAGSASFGDRRGIGSADEANARLETNHGVYDAAILLELPLERTAERNRYRQTLIALEQSVRDLQDLEDEIKLDVRAELRDLLAAREGVVTQAKSVTLANRRVDSTDMLLQAGRAEIRDVLEAQTDLVDAQNEFTTSLVEYRISELELQQAMGVLNVNYQGIWQEFDPKSVSPTTQPVLSSTLRLRPDGSNVEGPVQSNVEGPTP